MAETPPISELLQQVKAGDTNAAGPIVEHYWEAANKVILRRLSPPVRRLVASSDIANAALRSALSHVGSAESGVQDRDEFWRLLVTIIQRKAASAGRYALAEGRDTRRTAELTDQATRERQSPLEHLVAADLGQRVATLLLDEPDEYRQLVADLGIHEERSSAEIRGALAEVFPAAKPQAIRTIQSWLSATRKRVADELVKDFADE